MKKSGENAKNIEKIGIYKVQKNGKNPQKNAVKY